MICRTFASRWPRARLVAWVARAALLLGMAPDFALYVVSAVVLGLLYIGIHNAWDAAVYVGAYRHTDGEA